MSSYDPVYHETTSIISRPTLVWPDDCRVAIAIVVCAEYYELQPPGDAFMPPNLPGGFGRAPYPDVRAFSQREYGNRVGIFRVMEALDGHGIRATAAVDASVATRYPYLVEQFLKRHWEIAGHGYSLTRVISNRMSEDEEHHYIAECLDILEAASGVRPSGWHGPEYGESQRTPALLAKLGIRYVLDWPNDEQPYRMDTPFGPLISIPMALELDDVITNYHRRISMARWAQAVTEAVAQLVADSPSSGRHLVLNLHPWLIGHPHRIGLLEELLDTLTRCPHVWMTTAGEIASCAATQLGL